MKHAIYSLLFCVLFSPRIYSQQFNDADSIDYGYLEVAEQLRERHIDYIEFTINLKGSNVQFFFGNMRKASLSTTFSVSAGEDNKGRVWRVPFFTTYYDFMDLYNGLIRYYVDKSLPIYNYKKQITERKHPPIESEDIEDSVIMNGSICIKKRFSKKNIKIKWHNYYYKGILAEDGNSVIFTSHYRRFMQLVEYLVMNNVDNDVYSSYKGKIRAYKSNYRYEVFDFENER